MYIYIHTHVCWPKSAQIDPESTQLVPNPKSRTHPNRPKSAQINSHQVRSAIIILCKKRRANVDFPQHVTLALTLPMSTFIENACTRTTVLCKKEHPNVDFSSRCCFGVDVADGHLYRESLRENQNSRSSFNEQCYRVIKHVCFSVGLEPRGACYITF